MLLILDNYVYKYDSHFISNMHVHRRDSHYETAGPCIGDTYNFYIYANGSDLSDHPKNSAV